MHHVAIMKKSWKLIPKIVSGDKTIESRWYQTKRAPWGKAEIKDKVYFKNSGEMVTAEAEISKVLQFEIKNFSQAKDIVSKHGKQICIVNPKPETWGKLPKYCILIFLKNPKSIPKPFAIDKKGYGSATAWMIVKDIKQVKI